MSERHPWESDDDGARTPRRVGLWLLLRADRRILAGTLFVFVIIGVLVIGAVVPVSLRETVGQSDPIETLFQALVTALITGVTLVVTINQLVLSQELGSVGDQRERMEGAMAFREDVEDVIGPPVSPADPAAFLQALMAATTTRAARFRESARTGDEQFRRRAEAYVETLTARVSPVHDRLDGAAFGTFDVLDAALEFDYSRELYRARRLRKDSAEVLSDEAREALDALIELLELFATAREHFKTLYFQWELIDLSRIIVYSAVPALVVTVAPILFLDDPRAIRGTTGGIDNLLWMVAGATAIAVLPFLLLASYVLRIATVAKRTLAIGPFILQHGRQATEPDRPGEEQPPPTDSIGTHREDRTRR